MSKGNIEQIQLALVGLILGCIFGIWFTLKWLVIARWVSIIGAIAGVVILGVIIGNLYKRASELGRTRITFGVFGFWAGLEIGAMKLPIFNPNDPILTTMPILAYLGSFIGAFLGMVFFAFVIGALVYKLKEKGKYQSFPIEIIGMNILGLGATMAVMMLTPEILYNIPSMGVIPIVSAIIFSVVPGMIVAGNSNRPLIGGILALIAGGLVSWFGIDIASILFMPGTGLYWAGMIIGLILLGMAIGAIAYPAMNMMLGTVIIVLSILSFIGAAGGLVVGGFCGLVGGALIVAWEPPAVAVDAGTGEFTEEAM
ncbi:MAG: DUF6114 domain-containing protein [Candidatus Saccharibacteria bacterium]